MRRLTDKEISSIAIKLHDDLLDNLITRDQFDALCVKALKKYEDLLKSGDAKVFKKYFIDIGKYFIFEHKTTKYIVTTKYITNKLEVYSAHLKNTGKVLYAYTTKNNKTLGDIVAIVRYHALTAKTIEILIDNVKKDIK